MAQMPSDADAATAALLHMGGLQSTVEPMSYYDPIDSRWTTGNFDQHLLQPSRPPAEEEEFKLVHTMPLPFPPSRCGPPFEATTCNAGVGVQNAFREPMSCGHPLQPQAQTQPPLPAVLPDSQCTGCAFFVPHARQAVPQRAANVSIPLPPLPPLPTTCPPAAPQVQCGATPCGAMSCGAIPSGHGHAQYSSNTHAASMIRAHGDRLYNLPRPHLPQNSSVTPGFATQPLSASPAQTAQTSATNSESAHTAPPCHTHSSPFSRRSAAAPSTYSSHCTSISSGSGTARAGCIPGPTYRSMSKLLESEPRLLDLHSEADLIGFPRGPVEGTAETLEEKVRQWATNPKTANGGHGIRKGGPGGQPSEKRGTRIRFQCSKTKERQGICKWECTFEETVEGWVLVRATWSHNGHDLKHTAAEVMAARGTQMVPEEIVPLGMEAALNGNSVGEVDLFLQGAARRRNLPVTWTREHIRYKFPFAATLHDFCLTGFVEHLREREREQSLAFEMLCDDKGTTSHIFVEMECGMLDWAVCEDNVLLFDPTWGTHRSGMKLCCFTSVTNGGETVIIACCLTRDETAESMLWCFRCFAKHFKRPPSVLFTDDGSSLSVAFASMHDGQQWANTKHFLCTFHLAKNFFKHVRPLVSDMQKWRQLNSWFWMFAKYSDQNFAVETEWASFTDAVERAAHGPTRGDCMLWLTGVYCRREQWMAKYTWQTTSWGIHSTQRAESIHAAIKGRKMKNLAAVALINALHDYNSTSRQRREVEAVRLNLRQLALSTVPPMIQPYKQRLTPYAVELLMAQYSLSASYQSTPEGDAFRVTYAGNYNIHGFTPTVDEDGNITSWQCQSDFGVGEFQHPQIAGHVANFTSCTCQYPQVFRLPCRHILHLHVTQQQSTLHFEICERWHVKNQDDVASKLFTLRASALRPGPTVQVNTGMRGKAERRSLLLDDILPLVDAAAANEEMFQVFLQNMPAISHSLRHRSVLSIPVARASDAQERPPSSTPATTWGSVIAAAGPREKTDDQMRIASLLGITYRTVPCPPALDITGRIIAIKYGIKVWYTARVLEEVTEMDTHGHVQAIRRKVKYSDGAEGVYELDSSLEWDQESNERAPRWSWMLLETADTSNIEGRVPMEARRHEIGRPATTRAAPAAGPTSNMRKRHRHGATVGSTGSASPTATTS